MQLDRRDRASFELGRREGLHEGITVPYVRLGDCMGSCTVACMRRPERADRLLGPAKVIGLFAFQVALRLLRHTRLSLPFTRLPPRPRNIVMFAGCGSSNQTPARSLGL